MKRSRTPASLGSSRSPTVSHKAAIAIPAAPPREEALFNQPKALPHSERGRLAEASIGAYTDDGASSNPATKARRKANTILFTKAKGTSAIPRARMLAICSLYDGLLIRESHRERMKAPPMVPMLPSASTSPTACGDPPRTVAARRRTRLSAAEAAAWNIPYPYSQRGIAGGASSCSAAHIPVW